MTSKLLIKTYGKAEGYSEANLIAGKHLLSLEDFQEFIIEEGDIKFIFDDGSVCTLVSSTQGEDREATKLIRNALVARPGSSVELDLLSSGYEINNILLTYA